MVKKIIQIRKARLKDIPQLISLWENYENYHKKLTKAKYMQNILKTNSKAKTKTKKYFENKITSKESEILLVESGKVLGFIMLSIYDSSPISSIKKYGHIGYFFVKRNMRGKGIGKKIYKKSLEWFKDKKIKRISLEVNFLNKKTIELYKKLGFKEFEINMIKDFD